jgi:hypothetical protein
MATNGATKSKITKNKTNKKFLKAAQIAEQGKLAKYNDHYEKEITDHVIAMVIEAGGQKGESFLAEIKRWFAVPGINKVKLGNLVNWMNRRISFHQANFLEKMYIEAFKSIKRYELQHPAELPPPLVMPNVDEAIYPRFSQDRDINADEDDQVAIVATAQPTTQTIAEQGQLHDQFHVPEPEDDIVQQQFTNRLLAMLRPAPATSSSSSSTHLSVQPSNNHRLIRNSNQEIQQQIRIIALNQRLDSLSPSSPTNMPVIQNHQTNLLLNILNIPTSSSIIAPSVHSSNQNGQSSSSSSTSFIPIVFPVPLVEQDQPNHPSYSAVDDAEVDAIIANGLALNQAH